MTLQLGIIGYSDGNGHPYSWSAIFNGYEPESMARSGYPTISAYLAEQDWPAARLRSAKVTKIWTQDPARSESIARASLIEEIAGSVEELVDGVDAVLLARDDAENHFTYAEAALKAGKPIYIDKPIAHSIRGMNFLYEHEEYSGQIFTCSALRYARELELSIEQRQQIGSIVEIHAVTPKSWRKYGVHIIEPVLNILDASATPEEISASPLTSEAGSAGLSVRWSSGVVSRFFALGRANTGIRLHVFGTDGECVLTFRDSFSAFRTALSDFMDGIQQGENRSPKEFNRRVVELIEAGCG